MKGWSCTFTASGSPEGRRGQGPVWQGSRVRWSYTLRAGSTHRQAQEALETLTPRLGVVQCTPAWYPVTLVCLWH